ncbi:MAG: thiol:disulfide interchange protein [Myxococcota bacterium]|jgi:thiol:disulfide interchange protein
MFAMLVCLAVCGAGHAATPQLALPVGASFGVGDEATHLRAFLLINTEEDSPQINTAGIGVLFELEEGWHLYWKNPGDTGLAPEIEIDAGGAEVAALEWPTPLRFATPGTSLASYGYSDRVLLASRVSNYNQTRHVTVDVDLLLCKDECIPFTFSLERERPNEGSRSTEQRENESQVFGQFRELIPKPAADIGLGVRAEFSPPELQPGDSFEATLTLTPCVHGPAGCTPFAPTGAQPFIPDLKTDEAIDLTYLGSSPNPADPTESLLRFRGEVDNDADGLATRFAGLLSLERAAGDLVSVVVDVPTTTLQTAAGSPSAIIAAGSTAPQAPLPANSGTSLLGVIALALLGGLILNGMPCVLPILGIKICSAAELAQHDKAQLRRHGAAYLLGVLLSMAVLAFAVIFLKAIGASVGWGFQFQEPLFVGIVAGVVVLFALNLFGVFEIGLETSSLSQVGATAQGPARSFFDGLLAVVLATPCTAPFLGTAVGFAFAGGSAMIIATFLAIGVGLASPYVLICLIPGWSRFVPRAGNWMLRLRAAMGFLLLATAVWLVWVFGRSTGADSQAALLAVLVALSFGAWLFGWVQSQGQPRTTFSAVAVLFVFGMISFNRIDVEPIPAANVAPNARWKTYDADAIKQTLADGSPVFVSFTADWCITCKVNERGVLADDRVLNALSAAGFVAFRGDWTQRDEAIRRELAKHGRAGVPLYLVYDPRTPNHPEVLPELLSVNLVLSSLAGASPAAPEKPQVAARAT